MNNVFTAHTLDIIKDELFPNADPIQFKVPMEITGTNKNESLNPYLYRNDSRYDEPYYLADDNDPNISLVSRLNISSFSLDMLDYYYNGQFAWDGRYEEFGIKLLTGLRFNKPNASRTYSASIGEMVVINGMVEKFPDKIPGADYMIGYVDMKIETNTPEIEVYSRYAGSGKQYIYVNGRTLIKTDWFKEYKYLNKALILFYRESDGKYLYGYFSRQANSGGGGKDYNRHYDYPDRKLEDPTNPRTLTYSSTATRKDIDKIMISMLHEPTYTLANQRVEELVKMDLGNADTINIMTQPYEIYTNPITDGRSTPAFTCIPLKEFPTYYVFKPILKPRDKTITSVDRIIARVYLT